MAVNKVEYAGETLLDLTGDTLSSADQLLSGVTAHGSSGEAIVGSLAFITCYSGSDDPSASIGSDGDIYLKV